MKRLIHCFSIGFSLSPRRAVFHEELRSDVERPPQGAGVPVDVERKGPDAEVLRSGDLFHSDYTKPQPYAPEPPDQRAAWRFLPPFAKKDPSGKDGPSQAEYRKLPEDQREAYLKKHNAVIQASYAADRAFYERLPASSKVPRLRPSLIDRPELLVQTPIYAIGGWMSEGIAKNFRGGDVDYVPGANPAAALLAFEEVVKRASPEKLKGASAVVTFDPDLFGSQMPHEEYVEGTKKLLTRLKELGMVTIVLTPLKTWNFDLTGVPADRNVPVPPGWSKDQIMARQRRNEYAESLARFRNEGLITSFVDLADATQANDTMGTNAALLTTEDGRKVLNGQGFEMAVNGAIMGINAANGYDGGDFSTSRYWPGGEDYELGKTSITGKPIEPVVAGSPLVDQKLRDAARERVMPKDPLDTLRRLDSSLMGSELLTGTHQDLYTTYKNERFIPGMHVFSHPARKAVDEAFTSVKRAEAAGQNVTELISEFSRLASSVYVKLARVAIIHARELFEDPQYLMYRKEAYEHARKNVENAEAANNFYHFFDGNVAGLKKEWGDFRKEFRLA